MRPEVFELQKLGPLPPADEVSVEWLTTFGNLVDSIRRPVTDEEARVLVKLFGTDDCFEAVWSLVQLIETAPGWPLWDCLQETSNEWIAMLRQRLKNAGIEPPNEPRLGPIV